MADIITLENSVTPDRAVSSSLLPHWTVLGDPRVAADIIEPNYPGIDEFRGSAMGQRMTVGHSGIGMFRDSVGNTIMVIVESSDIGKIVQDKKLWGPTYKVFNIDRPMGDGWGHRAVPILSLKDREEARKLFKKSFFDRGEHNQHGFVFTNFYDLLRQIEERQVEIGTVVLRLSGEPITFSDVIGHIVLGLATVVAKAFGPAFGISNALIDSLTPVLTDLVDGKPISVTKIAQASTLISPESIRPFISKASNVYLSVEKGDYAAAAQQLGVMDVKAVQDLYAFGSKVIATTSGGVGSTMKIAQSFINIDTINKLRNQLISGSVLSKIIDEGSITRVPAIQNVLVAIQADGFVGTLPNVTDFVSTALNGTNDDLDGVAHRALLSMGLGKQPLAGDTYELTIRALTEQAIEAARRGQEFFFMPASLSELQREIMGAEVARQSGVRVVSRSLNRKEWY